MRIFPIIAAFIASVLVYLFIFQRDSLSGGAESTPATDENVVTSEPSQDAAEDANAVRVIAVKSIAREIDSALVIRGQTEADREVELQSETSGQVISNPLRKGAFVTAGDVLCELDPATREANLAEAIARLAEAKTRIPEAKARQKEAEAQLSEAMINNNASEKLSEGGYASDVRLAQTRAAVSSAEALVEAAASGVGAAQSGIQSAEASVAAAEKEIERLRISAPFDGLLESDTAELGSLLLPGGACATVIQLDPIKLVGFVPETEISRITLGADARARMATGDDVTGQVSFLSRSADQITRTFRVEIQVPNPDLILRDGQTTEIRISAEGNQAHLLPQSALTLNDAGVLGVRIVGPQNTAKFVPVVLLKDTNQGIWLAGLPDTAEVIIIGQEYIIDGVPVLPTYQELGQ
ncbi:efflux RND transporter periplasmic adaptor subunit [Roseovarius sp. EL26]|uniref:efflux RND transporter periplasmic adaptor subunit n=1 Tax=Roseovarius sp. EL26 TaxID=2126672 RepID=UPI000EA343EA|nr:efflux RND transporter periplasmic adaptor subunit [Roseovarius sp. EL26]